MATSSSEKPADGLGANDLGPLAWVLDELRKSLDTASKSLKRYVRDAELARGSDLSAVDASQLRIARQQLHQSVGALEMVGFAAPASMLRGMETVAQKFVTKPELCSEDAANKVERASFALIGYLEALLAGRSPSAIELFSQYAEVQELAGSTRIHPADLWGMSWRWMPIKGLDEPTVELDINFRARFDKFALQVVKTADIQACADLSLLCASLARQITQQVDPNFKTFWRIAAGAMEAVSSGSLAADLYFKRTVSRVLILVATHAKGDMSVPERLAQDLLFFCAQASPQGKPARLMEVRSAYGLDSYTPVDYSRSYYGQFDPTVLVQARKRIAQLKESWSAFTAGELSKAKPVQDQMSLLVDSIQKLLPKSGQNLVTALNEVVDSTARQQRTPDPALGMEVATAILYVEASFEDFDPDDAQQSGRISHLAQRVQMVRGGAASPPLEGWMEDLYRRVSDRQTMGSVVGELKLTLGELEKLMDTYFRDPQDKVLLADVPGKLSQMRGVLTVLGLDQASHAVHTMRDSVEGLMMTELDVERAKAAGTFDKLGNNLGALGFLIDMLSYQPILAKKLFIFNESTGELTPLMGRTIHEPEAFAEPEMPVEMSVFGGLDMFSEKAVEAQASKPAELLAQAIPAAPAISTVAVVVDSDEVDPELLEIFIEEAREVVGNGQSSIKALRTEPNNIGEMTTLRRAFHTLKGSSRMVGLNVFGEAAWSMEQMLNSWLADQKHATVEFCNLAQQAMEHHASWIEEIAVGRGKERTAEPFHTSADAMRLNGQFVPIDTAVAVSVSAMVPELVSQPVPNVDLPAEQALNTIILNDSTSTIVALVASEPAAPETKEFKVASDELSPNSSQTLTAVALGASALSGLALAGSAGSSPVAELSATQSRGTDFDAVALELPADAFEAAFSSAPETTLVSTASEIAQSVTSQPIQTPSSELSSGETFSTDIDFGELNFDFAAQAPASQTTVLSENLVAAQLDAMIQTPPIVSAVDATSSTGVSIVTAAPTIEPFEIVQTELVSEDELAAFERAMLEMDASAPLVMDAEESLPSVPAPLIESADSIKSIVHQATSDNTENKSNATNIDAQSFEALSAQHWTAQSASAISSSAEPTQLIAPDFISSPTQPMGLDAGQMQVKDLGVDLGDWGAPSAPASASVLGVVGAAAGLGAVSALNDREQKHKGDVNSAFAPDFSMSAPSASDFGALGAYSAEEQFKAIGPLRVSLPLYNVYLNEADEWSRRLATVLTEWAMEPSATVSNDAVAFAHSLAGSSATVGFTALSGLARHLENALVHMQRIEQDADYDPHLHADLFVSAAEQMRGLLHQFAAGFLKDASPQTEEDLLHCLQAPFPVDEPAVVQEDSEEFFALPDTSEAITVISEPVSSVTSIEHIDHSSSSDSAKFVTTEAPAALTATPVLTATQTGSEASLELPVSQSSVSASGSALSSPDSTNKSGVIAGVGLVGAALAATSIATTVTSAPAAMAAPVAAPSPVANKQAAVEAAPALSVAPVLHVRSHQATQEEIDDEIDAVDAIDPDLFEIFEEEAQELFPSTASALRQWSSNPDNMSARGELLRGLHTLKGSARLAGAMRLGEMAHRMESSVENIPHEGAQSDDIEALMGQLDGMQHTFDVLRNHALGHEATRMAPMQPQTPPQVQPLQQAATAAASEIASSVAQATPAPGLTPMRSFAAAGTPVAPTTATRVATGQTVRVRAQLLDRLMNQAGEVMITRARLEAELSQLRGSLTDLQGNLEKLRVQLRELDVQAESQMQTRIQQAKEADENFDPLEFDRYTRVQELTRMMAESVNDVATVQRNIQRTIESTEDDLIAQARQTRELQRDLLRTRMVEFEGISERLYRVVRQAGKDAGKQVKLDIIGGSIEMDRGVLDRMTPAFEHLLRNCVAHGIEAPDQRTASGKNASGEIVITLHQEGNDVSLEFRDDGAGLNLLRIREKAQAQGLIAHDVQMDDSEAANLIFTPGFSTAAQVTELSGRGVGMDVVRSEVVALGGRIETSTSSGQGTSFKLVLPLTTAVTQVVMVRIGQMAIGIPANLVEIVRRASQKELQQAYNTGSFDVAGESLPFFWAGALLQHCAASSEPASKTTPVAIFRSAAQRIAVHIDEVLGNQEVVVKNLGPQLSRLPGLAGMTVLASGAVALIYNPVALATVYGVQARAMSSDPAQPHMLGQTSASSSQFAGLDTSISDAQPRELTADAVPVKPLVPANPASISAPTVPLVLVVDDSITVRRVTQRLLQREGYRVSMAADGLQALERLAEELPSVILSDIEMPRMDGFDLLRNVRADEKFKHLPTIMITSRIAEKHRDHAMELGANHYLGKPYNEEELLSLIRRYAREEVAPAIV